jgi:putative transposase
MPRISRGLADGHVYHIINRGNDGKTVFRKDMDYIAFLELLGEAKGYYELKLFAYCLMPNHFHLVLMPLQAEDLSKGMQWLMTSHVRRYHRHYGSMGHVWQGRYKSFLIQTDEHLLTVIHYVESNPLRAGLVQMAGKWRWSSHLEFVGIRPRSLVDDPPIDLPKNWETFVNEPMATKDLEQIRQSVNRQAPYGDHTWQIERAKEFRLESTMRPRGRPRSGGENKK